jgi:hypothetical protein
VVGTAIIRLYQREQFCAKNCVKRRKSMQGKHRIPPLCSVLLALLLGASAFLMFLSSPGNARAASVTIVTHQVVGSEVAGEQTLSASCASGEQLLSGGYSISADEQAAKIMASYPSAADTWTVTVEGISFDEPAQLTVDAYCLQASYSLGTTIVQAPSAGSGLVTADCPGGSTLIGGGFSGETSVTIPVSNGWQTKNATAYAICATQNVTATSLASTTFTIPTGFPLASASANCPSGQIASGGGYNSPLITSSGSTGDYAGWGVGAEYADPGGSTATVWAVCASFPNLVLPPTTPTVTPTTPVVTPTTPTVTPTTPVVTPTTPTVTPTPSQSPARITYQVISQWAGGFTVQIEICNIGPDPISGWTLQFTFPDDQQITQGWNGNFGQSGELVTITNVSYNGLIAPGACIYLGFNGVWTTGNASPTSFLLNGFPTS